MLKLTMNPRRRSRRHRRFPNRLRLPPTGNGNNRMEIDGEDNNANEKEELFDNIQAMVSQEAEGSYNCADYLSMTVWQQSVYQLLKKPDLSTMQRQPSGGVGNSRIDEYCREQIVEWSFRVVDYFRIDREVVAVSLSFLDRFLAKCRCDRTSFKLAATTTLHLAVKLLYPCKLADLGILSDLSRGEFDMADVCEMESHILGSLEWKLHPPTAIAFSSLLLDYFFCSAKAVKLSFADCDDIYDVASFFSELAVCDYYFVTMHASSVALASILNALEGMFGPDNHFANEVMRVARAHRIGAQVDLGAARNRLWELYERSEECALHSDSSNNNKHSPVKEEEHSNIFVKKTTLSPVSVSKPCHSASEFCASTRTKLRNGSW